MKYNININQLVLGDTGLDLTDAAILDYLIYYCNSKNEKIDKQRMGGYTWINYQTILSDMPLLKIKRTHSLTPRIQKIRKEGFIETKIIMRGGGQNSRKLFIKLTEKVDSIYINKGNRLYDYLPQDNYENEGKVIVKTITFKHEGNRRNDLNNNTIKEGDREGILGGNELKKPESLKNMLQKAIGATANSKEQEKFLDYWEEKSPNSKKERWQKEKVFDIKRRWARWLQNSKDWDKKIPVEMAPAGWIAPPMPKDNTTPEQREKNLEILRKMKENLKLR